MHGSLGREGRNIGSRDTVRLAGNGLRIDVIVELHVTGMDAEDFQATALIGSTIRFGFSPGNPTLFLQGRCKDRYPLEDHKVAGGNLCF